MTKKTSLSIGMVILVLVLLMFLEYNGYIWHNEILTFKYPIKGIDISHHQGNINWKDVSKNKKYKFVFIKATEGNDFRDKLFLKNWKESKDNNMLHGAYHFFTTGSSGLEQAQNFISVVPKENGTLPPVIDIEVGGLSKDVFQKELKSYINSIEEYYGQKPILYVMYPLYEAYIKGDFEDYPIWIRDIIKYPTLKDEREWTFWQYGNRGHVKGINTYVDLNCFNGTLEELKRIGN